MTTFFGAASALTRANLDLVPNLYIDIQDHGYVIGSEASASINAALAFASSMGGGTVVLPQGNIAVGAQISVPANCELLGSDSTVLLVPNGSTLATTLVILAGNKSRARNFMIDGNRSHAVSGISGGLATLGGTLDWVVDNVEASNCTGIGIALQGKGKFRSLIAKNNGQIGIMLQTTDAQGHDVEASSNVQEGITIQDGCTGLQLTAPLCKSNGGHGLMIFGRTTSGIVVIAPHCLSNVSSGLAFVTTDNAQVIGGISELNGVSGVLFFGARYCEAGTIKSRNNSQTTNGANAEIQLSSDGTTNSIGNVITAPDIRITGANKANFGIREVTVNDGPTTIVGGWSDAGTTGKFFLLHPASRNIGVGNVRDSEDPQTNIASANYTTLDTDYYVRVTTGAGDRIITIPDPTTAPGRSLIVFKVDSGAGKVKIASAGVSKTINGASEYDLTAQFQSVLLVSNGTQWDAM